MWNYIKYAMDSLRKFTVADVAIFKLNLCLVGILFGAYFSDFLLKYIAIVWIAAAITYIFLWVQIIRYGRKKKE